MKVLLVDDSVAVRSRLAALLRELPGVEPAEAADGEAALAHLGDHETDVVVLDLHMPGRGGLEVLPEIKARPHPPMVIVLTNHPTELHRAQCLAQGADLFLDKAREFGRLLDVIVRPTTPRA